MPIVSVLLPDYNGGPFLNESIQSVIDQSIEDWELIIQDDCSQDNSEAIIMKYKDPRISFARNKTNLHIAGNLNVALARANGKYIQLLGQDDRLLPNCLEEHLDFWESHPDIGFTFCPPLKISAEGERLINASHIWDAQYVNTPQVCMSEEGLLLFYNYGCMPGSISTVMIRRDCLEHVGNFDTSFKLCLDWEMWIRLTKRYGFGFIHKRLVELRSHDGQESANPTYGIESITEKYRCLGLIEQGLPTDLHNALHWGKHKKYGAEAMNSVIHALASFQFGKVVEYLRVIQSNDCIGLAFYFWVLEIPGIMIRKLTGRGKYSFRQAFDNDWLLKKQALYGIHTQQKE